MKRNLTKRLIWLLPLFFLGCATVDNPPETVAQVNLERYMGTWYEISAFPDSLQAGCRCTMARYKLSGDHIEMVNTCLKGNQDNVTISRGIAWHHRGEPNSKLEAQFFKSFHSGYWILYLSPDYRHALVGTPNRKHLWILSRQPQMEAAQYNKMTDLARQQGYDIKKLVRTDQSC
ncbi:MAG: lipocalin family protein [Gammaproteobacteria bacterium]